MNGVSKRVQSNYKATEAFLQLCLEFVHDSIMPPGGGLLTGNKTIIEGSRAHSVEREYAIAPWRKPQFEAFSALCRELGEPEYVVAIA